MTYTGNLQKMGTQLSDTVEYTLKLNDEAIPLNPVIGQKLTLTWNGNIECVHCGRKTKKSFSQGYCYPCFRKLAQCDMCIMKPEQCHYDAGTCREPEWGEANCMAPHYVYLANSSGVKVGITRHTQLPTRWLDQGATQALAVFKVDSRRTSGLVEVLFKEYVADKTSWQKMLKGSPEPVDLAERRDILLDALKSKHDEINNADNSAQVIALPEEKPVDIQYPVLEYPKKVSSHNFDKNPEVSGTLMGIKGQYLIFDNGVINIRKFGGYEVTASSEAF